MASMQAVRHTQLSERNSGWTEADALRNAEAIEGLLEHPGYHALLDAFDAYEGVTRKKLMGLSPTDNGAVYADLVGQLRGLQEAKQIAAHIHEHGRFIEQMEREEKIANG